MFELWYKQIKDKKLKKSSLSMKTKEGIIKDVPAYRDQFAKDMQAAPNTFEFAIVDRDKKAVVWFDIGYSEKQLKNKPELADKFKKAVAASKLEMMVGESFDRLRKLAGINEEALNSGIPDREKAFKKIAAKFPKDSKSKVGGKVKIMLTGDSAKVIGRKDYDSVTLDDLSFEELKKLADLFKVKL